MRRLTLRNCSVLGAPTAETVDPTGLPLGEARYAELEERIDGVLFRLCGELGKLRP